MQWLFEWIRWSLYWVPWEEEEWVWCRVWDERTIEDIGEDGCYELVGPHWTRTTMLLGCLFRWDWLIGGAGVGVVGRNRGSSRVDQTLRGIG